MLCPGCGRPLFQGRCLGTSAAPACAPRAEAASPAKAPAGASPIAAAAVAAAGGDVSAAIAAYRGAIVRRLEDTRAMRGFGTVLKPQATVRSMLGMREPVLRVAWDDGTESKRKPSTLAIATPDELRQRAERFAAKAAAPPRNTAEDVAAWDPVETPEEEPSSPGWCGRCGTPLTEGRCIRAGCPGV